MEFLKEIARALGAPADAFRIRYTVVDGRGGYFQNVKRLVQFSETEVVLRGGRGSVRIAGRGLSLGKYFAGDLVVEGEILQVQRVD